MRNFYITFQDKLVHNISIKSYEKFLLNLTNFEKQLPEEYRKQAKLAVKDEYMFDFMELSVKHSERELEQELIKHIKKFLSEIEICLHLLGTSIKIVVGGDEFFIDLLLYHRKLRCLVAIELKIGKFEPSDLGNNSFT